MEGGGERTATETMGRKTGKADEKRFIERYVICVSCINRVKDVKHKVFYLIGLYLIYKIIYF